MGRAILQGLKVYPRFLLLHVRMQVEYEVDFWLGILGIFLSQLAGLLFVWTLFSRVPSIAGWTLPESALLYALLLIPRGLVDIFCDGPWQLPALVNSGDFDRMRLRPVPLLIQVFTRSSRIHGLGHLGLGGYVIYEATQRLGFEWTGAKLAFLAVTLAASVVIVTAISLAANCVAFWDRSGSVAMAVFALNLGDAAVLPLTLYPRLLQGLLTWVVPFAFVSYFPACALLGKPLASPVLGWSGPLAALASATVAGLIWKRCVHRYDSTGS
ncbi:MAG TPA: ABC-2 family transporter protein [Myxococcaceae bacterium]|jgi:ABC-2 type transport system permease protein